MYSLTEFTARPLTFAARAALLVLGTVSLLSVEARAQATDDVGIGGQIGDPSGISLILERPRSGRFDAYDFLAAWDFGRDRFFLNAHALFTRPILFEDAALRSFYGPGVFVGFRERDRRDDEADVGVSGTFGISAFFDQVEIYVRITPRLAVIPDTDGELGGGLGIRYHF